MTMRCQAVVLLLLLSHARLCNHMDGSLPGFAVHEIFQARMLEWVDIPSPEDLPDPGTEPGSLVSPALAGRLFATNATWEAPINITHS